VKGEGLEFCFRETEHELFVLACKRNHTTDEVEFSGLPQEISGGRVLFEEPRKVVVQNGKFTDWFAPFEVHVYRFLR